MYCSKATAVRGLRSTSTSIIDVHRAKSNSGVKRSNGRFIFISGIELFAILFNCSRFSQSKCNRRSVLPKPSEQLEQLTRTGGPPTKAAQYF